MDSIHYLRFVRALTLTLSGMATACASAITPSGDGSVDAAAAGPDASGDADSACPATVPTTGSSCPSPMSCQYNMYNCGEWMSCACAATDGGLQAWSCQHNCVIGPLPPPDLCASGVAV